MWLNSCCLSEAWSSRFSSPNLFSLAPRAFLFPSSASAACRYCGALPLFAAERHSLLIFMGLPEVYCRSCVSMLPTLPAFSSHRIAASPFFCRLKNSETTFIASRMRPDSSCCGSCQPLELPVSVHEPYAYFREPISGKCSPPPPLLRLHTCPPEPPPYRSSSLS